jgi:hypothetical protein
MAGLEAAGSSPFVDDPGLIQPAVIRAVASLAFAQLRPSDQADLTILAPSCGLGAILAALTAPGHARHLLGAALAHAISVVQADPVSWKRYGSDFVMRALQIQQPGAMNASAGEAQSGGGAGAQ